MKYLVQVKLSWSANRLARIFDSREDAMAEVQRLGETKGLLNLAEWECDPAYYVPSTAIEYIHLQEAPSVAHTDQPDGDCVP